MVRGILHCSIYDNNFFRAKANEDEDDDDDLDEDAEAAAAEDDDDIEPIGDHFSSMTRRPSIPLQRYVPPEHCLCCKMALCGPYHEKNPK